jgi:ribosomal-protein-alanine N-acetyltransferase
MEVTIRELKKEDAIALSRIEAASFSEPWSEQAFAELPKAPFCKYVVAVIRGGEEQVVGCCGYTKSFEEASIDKVVVDEAVRGLGIGAAMLKALIELGEADGVRDFTLEVRVSNQAAIALYEKFGFASVGIRPNFYEKPREDANIMWRYGK